MQFRFQMTRGVAGRERFGVLGCGSRVSSTEFRGPGSTVSAGGFGLQISGFGGISGFGKFRGSGGSEIWGSGGWGLRVWVVRMLVVRVCMCVGGVRVWARRRAEGLRQRRGV